MHSLTKIAAIVILAALAVSVAFNFHLKYKLDHIPRESYIDTTFFVQPVPKDSLVIRYKTVLLPVAPQADEKK